MPCPPCGEVGGAGGGAWGPGGRPQGLNRSRGVGREGSRLVWPKGARSAPIKVHFPAHWAVFSCPEQRRRAGEGVWGPPGGAFESRGGAGEWEKRQCQRGAERCRGFLRSHAPGQGGARMRLVRKWGARRLPGGEQRAPASAKQQKVSPAGEKFSAGEKG